MFSTFASLPPIEVDEFDLFSVPDISSSRVERSIRMESFMTGPYRNKTMKGIIKETSLSCEQVRANDRLLRLRRQPITSKSAKVRGIEGATVQQSSTTSTSSSSDEIRMSLVVIGNKSTNVSINPERYIDPDLLLTKAPGFSTGISQKSFIDLKLEQERKARREESLKKLLEEEDVEEEQQGQDPIALVNPYPEEEFAEDKNNNNNKMKTKKEEYSKDLVNNKPWSVIDESDVSDFYLHVPHLAIKYPFELDAFQKRAVKHLEKGESVFVAAHTSAGKTVVAEYAIALAFEHRTRLIYTSPIKALSNQKFRDFSEKFGSEKVGLLTGDNAVNPDAPCVIMTTEILRSMLYRGAEMIRDIEFVVFDEVHYISDPDRGVIWEEVVIMLPLHVHVVMLSATTPNTEEFSAWVGRNRREQVFVVSTNKRPVPLEHFLYVEGDLFKIMDSNNQFHVDGYKNAEKSRLAKDPFADVPGRNNNSNKGKDQQFAAQKWSHSIGSGSKNIKTGENRWLDMVKDLEKKKLLPVIIFTFSKKQVEARAAFLLKVDLLNKTEQSAVKVFIQRALSRLQEADRVLPQIRRVTELLLKGIGIHHGGLLPILKEVVEICFTNGLVRVLIATETFAMGVNAPCRTVVFGGLRKHDGTEFRDLLPGEYIQMCGRAGRRGLDTVGTVLLLVEDDIPPLESLTRMLSGRSSQLQSRFRLKYSMLLNILRTDDELTVSDMMKRSFSEYSRSSKFGQNYMKIKNLKKELKEARKELTNFGCVKESSGANVKDIEEYHCSLAKLTNRVTNLVDPILSGTYSNRSKEEILKPGRIVSLSLLDLKLFSLSSVIVQETNERNVFIAIGILPNEYDLPVNAPMMVVSDSNVEESKMIGKRGKDDDNDDFFNKRKGKMKKKGGEDDDDDDSFNKGKGKMKKKGGEEEDDDFFAPRKRKMDVEMSEDKKQVIKKGEEFFKRDDFQTKKGNNNSANLDILPRATFGKFVDETGENKQFVICRISTKEIERITGLYFEITKTIAEKICLSRSESDAAKVCRNLVNKLSSSFGTTTRLDVIQHLKVNDLNLVQTWNRIEDDRERLNQTFCHSCPVQNSHRILASRCYELEKEIKQIELQLSDENLSLFPEFQSRLVVLRKLQYILTNEDGDEDTLELKGRVGCEINTSDELLLTEMIFNNIFDSLNPAECVAILSCLVLQKGKSMSEEGEIIPPTEHLLIAVEKCVEIATMLEEIQRDVGIYLDDFWLNNVFNVGLLLVTYEWALGRSFASITGLTTFEEGDIVRAITRLDETCREVKNIARLIGDPELLQKMEIASTIIKRDIVFATSLYVG